MLVKKQEKEASDEKAAFDSCGHVTDYFWGVSSSYCR
jgi:hypothetical protein